MRKTEEIDRCYNYDKGCFEEQNIANVYDDI